jgi:hypothetical protein
MEVIDEDIRLQGVSNTKWQTICFVDVESPGFVL